MLIDKLREHLDSITPEQFQKEWDELKEWNNVGPSAMDLVNSWERLYPNKNE